MTEKKRREHYKANGEEVTSKSLLSELFQTCIFLTKETKYVSDSPVIKKFVKTIKESSDDEISKWDDFYIEAVLKEKRRPYIFEALKFSKDELLELGISKNFINAMEEVLNAHGFHFNTKFTDLDLQKIFVVHRYFLDRNFEIKLSLSDEQICDYKKRTLKR